MSSTSPGLARVLFVPDDLLSGDLRDSFLNRESMLVRTADDADMALTMVEIWRPSLVVFRSDLGSMRVSDFCGRLRNSRRAVAPKLMMVTEQVSDTLQDAVEAGCDCHLISPIGTEQLLEAIAALLDVSERRAPRAPLETLVQLSGLSPHKRDDKPTLGNAISVSEEGILVECSDELDVHAHGSLQFFLPGVDQRLQLCGVVKLAVDEVRLHYAIEWKDLPANDRALIHRYVQESNAS